MTKPCILLIDFNNLLYRATFANQGLSYRGKFTGGIYGFINMISGAVNRYSVDRVLVCHDTKPYFRSDYFPAYKQNRQGLQDEDDVKRIAVARSQIADLLQGLSFPQAACKGYEADDYIGKYCRSRKMLLSRILIMSNDSDFYQLLGGKAGKVYLVKTAGLYGQHQFKEDYPKIEPEDWPRVIALKGSHNGVPGFKGIGDKTAARLVGVEDGIIEEKYGESPDASIKLKTELATFPFPKVSWPRLPAPRPSPIDYDLFKLEEICDKYGIRMKDEFHTAFERLSK
jgi:DNA polymerase-1